MTVLAFVLYILGMYQTFCVLAASGERPEPWALFAMLILWPIPSAVILVGVVFGMTSDWWEDRNRSRGD